MVNDENIRTILIIIYVLYSLSFIFLLLYKGNMLRSIFSLIYKIKNYEEDLKQSKANSSNQPNIIFYHSHPDCIPTPTTTMDKRSKTEETNEKSTKPLPEEISLKVNSAKGDVVTCSPVVKPKADASKKRTTFINKDQETEKNEEKDQSELSTNRLNELLHTYTKKQKRLKGRDSDGKNKSPDKDELSAITKQVTKMQDGIEKLKSIAQNFNCLDKFKEDVEHIRKYINLASMEKKD